MSRAAFQVPALPLSSIIRAGGRGPALMSTTEATMKTLARKTFHKLRAFRARRINKLDFRVTFPRLLKNLKRIHGTDAALKWAVGGEFEAIGFLELEVLKYFGLKEDDYVVDVGCGSGRL